MRSPTDMGDIQIEMTNACPRNCARFSRHCGRQRRPFFMGLSQALDFMEGYAGKSGRMLGIMGGEPALHQIAPAPFELERLGPTGADCPQAEGSHEGAA